MEDEERGERSENNNLLLVKKEEKMNQLMKQFYRGGKRIELPILTVGGEGRGKRGICRSAFFFPERKKGSKEGFRKREKRKRESVSG